VFVGLGVVLVVSLLTVWPTGRQAVQRAWAGWPLQKYAWLKAAGFEPDRTAIDQARARQRAQGMIEARARATEALSRLDPGFRHLVEAGGLDPREAVFRWGNVDLTFWLSRDVFAPDDTGRSYVLRPHVRAVWARQLHLPEPNTSQLLVPDTPAVRAAAAACGTELLLDRAQTTNAWSCRGAEPKPDADLRILVLGDSYMQGLLLTDDQTPPAQLQAELERLRPGRSVSVLNTGVLGYSPEQYYFTMKAYLDRFRPHAVVVSVFANDVGNEHAALDEGRGDWDEAAYWLGRIAAECRPRQIPALLVPVVWSPQLTGHRKALTYPARLIDPALWPTEQVLDPIEWFVDATLARPHGSGPNPLFNSALRDGHYSAAGAELWAQVVAPRLNRLLRPGP
jgi:hypothetical protein